MFKRLLLPIVLVLAIAGSAAADPQTLPTVNIEVDGMPVQGDTPAVVLNGHTMVPLRLISQAMGATITWDEARQTAQVNTTPITAPLRAALTKAQQDLSTTQAELTAAQSELAAAQTQLAATQAELTKTRAPLAAGGAPVATTITPVQYLEAIQATTSAGPSASATLGKAADCVPVCGAWDESISAIMTVYSKPFLAYGVRNHLTATILGAPYTLVVLSLRTDKNPAFSVDLTSATLSVDSGAPVKAAYISEPQVALRQYAEHDVTLVFPVAVGQQAALTFDSPVRRINLIASMPALPEAYAGYAQGIVPPDDFAGLANQVYWHRNDLYDAPRGNAPAAFPAILKSFAQPLTDAYIQKKLGPASPLLNGKYLYLMLSFGNDTASTIDIPPSAFAITSATTGHLLQPVAFLSTHQSYQEDYNGLFIYPGHHVEVFVVYPKD